MKETFNKLIRKRRVCSAEAAGASIVVHVLLILLAGSIVAVRHIEKRDAELDVVISEPKLERRQLEVPQKMERVRRTSKRPKIITTQAAASATEFSAPDIGDVGEVSTQSFDSPFARSGRDFRALAGGIGVGVPQFKFLGIRGEGEKVVFVIDASQEMLSPETGGVDACDYIKRELDKVLAKLPSSVLFNTILYDGENIVQFRPRMVPVTQTNRVQLTEWVKPFLGSGGQIGVAEEQNTYVQETVYETAIGEDSRNWLRALQAALESRPETVFIVGRGWGNHGISREKGQRLVNFTLWQLLTGGGKSGVGGAPGLKPDRELRDALILQAVEAIEDEEDLRRITRDPAQFLRDLIAYIQYSEGQIIDHVDTIVRFLYTELQMPAPWIHFVRLVTDDEEDVIDDSVARIRDLVRYYSGEFEYLNGMDAAKRMREPEKEEDVFVDLFADGPKLPESNFEFFDIRAKGTRIAFVLDASPLLLEEDVGGTNTFEFLKRQFRGMTSVLSSNTRFNVIVSDRKTVSMFRPRMTSNEAPAAVSEWLDTLSTASLPEEEGRYEAGAVYDTAIGADVSGIPLAMQAAMEQEADVILVAAAGLGRLPVEREKARRLLNFSIIDALGQGAGSFDDTSDDTSDDEEEEEDSGDDEITAGAGGAMAPLLGSLFEDKRQRAALIAQALTRIEEEMEEREDAELPFGFIHDILDYIEYLPEHILDHLAVVGEANYPMDDDEPILPQVHFTLVVEPEGRVPREELRVFRRMMRTYEGEMKLFQGAPTDKETRKLNRMLDLYP